MDENKLNILLQKSKNHYNKNELLLAEHFANKAYKIAIKVSTPIIISDILHNMATFYYFRKTFESSIEYYNKSIKICRNISESNDLAEVVNGLGQVYKALGDYQKAINAFTYAIEILDKNYEYFATHYCDLARIQKTTNNIKDASQTYQKSISSAQAMIAQTKSENHKFYEQVVYNCYNDLSEIELIKSQLQLSKNYHKQALHVLENSKSDIGTFFEGYKRFEIPAKIYIKEEKYNQAIEQLQKAKEAIIWQYKGFEVGKDLANIIHQIGDCYVKLKQYDKALVSHQKALIAVCSTFNNEDIKELPAIEDIYNKRSAIASLSFKAATFLLIFEEKKQLKALEQAYETYQLITALIPITRRDYVEENSKFQLADETRGIYEKAIATCLTLHQLTDNNKYIKDAFYFAESSKAIVLQENLQANYALEGMDETIQQQDISYRSKIAFYENSINTNKTVKGNEAQIENWQKELYTCKETYEDFQKQIEQNYPNYYKVKYAHAIANIHSIQKTLTSETALVEYFSGYENIYVFVITADQFFVYTIDTNNQLLEEDIKQFNQHIHQPDRSGNIENFQTYKKLSNRLFKNLLSIGISRLKKSIKRLIIIPEGLLYNISFDALLSTNKEHQPAAFYGFENLDYLHKQFAISYNYSATMLLGAMDIPNKTHQNTFCGFAPDFKNLENNINEVEQIKDYLGGENKISKAANFEHFTLSAQKSKILHLSTHAKQHESNHKLSEIQFADTTITNYHIENMKINAGLTVLSACETGSGFIQSGEGAMSLARSFFLAGCPSLVSSLWRADDEGTADIMLYFYQNLNAGETKDIALQKAKLQYCKDAGIRESHPFYWAGFVQSGNRKALF